MAFLPVYRLLPTCYRERTAIPIGGNVGGRGWAGVVWATPGTWRVVGVTMGVGHHTAPPALPTTCHCLPACPPHRHHLLLPAHPTYTLHQWRVGYPSMHTLPPSATWWNRDGVEHPGSCGRLPGWGESHLLSGRWTRRPPHTACCHRAYHHRCPPHYNAATAHYITTCCYRTHFCRLYNAPLPPRYLPRLHCNHTACLPRATTACCRLPPSAFLSHRPSHLPLGPRPSCRWWAGGGVGRGTMVHTYLGWLHTPGMWYGGHPARLHCATRTYPPPAPHPAARYLLCRLPPPLHHAHHTRPHYCSTCAAVPATIPRTAFAHTTCRLPLP